MGEVFEMACSEEEEEEEEESVVLELEEGDTLAPDSGRVWLPTETLL